MSENESAGEKTEQPTEKRLRDAREQGNLPRSRELGTAAVFGAGVLAVMAMSGSIGRGATAWMKQALSRNRACGRTRRNCSATSATCCCSSCW